jgi:hypothetical protein
LRVFSCKFDDELARRHFHGIDLAEKANVHATLSATATALRNFDVSVPMKASAMPGPRLALLVCPIRVTLIVTSK